LHISGVKLGSTRMVFLFSDACAAIRALSPGPNVGGPVLTINDFEPAGGGTTTGG